MKAFVILPAMYSVLFLHYLALVQAGQFSEQMGLESFFLGQTSSSQELDIGMVCRSQHNQPLGFSVDRLFKKSNCETSNLEVFDSIVSSSQVPLRKRRNSFFMTWLAVGPNQEVFVDSIYRLLCS